jgi:hypothetical protein
VRRTLIMTLTAMLGLGTAAPAFVWARSDNGWIKFGDNQPASPQAGMIDSGGGTYFVADGWSVKSIQLKYKPIRGGNLVTKDATYKDGEWAASIAPVLAGTYDVWAELVIKKQGERDKTFGTGAKTVVVK